MLLLSCLLHSTIHGGGTLLKTVAFMCARRQNGTSGTSQEAPFSLALGRGGGREMDGRDHPAGHARATHAMAGGQDAFSIPFCLTMQLSATNALRCEKPTTGWLFLHACTNAVVGGV